MTKTSVRIGAFEIDDAELRGEAQGDRTLSIPCKSDPDLCMQLDAWDADTSVPAILDGEHSVLYREHYDSKTDAWSCVLPDLKRTRPKAGYLLLQLRQRKVTVKYGARINVVEIVKIIPSVDGRMSEPEMIRTADAMPFTHHKPHQPIAIP